MKYQIIYADPCWDYKGQTQTGKTKYKGSTFRGDKKWSKTGGASSHYPTMTLKELKLLNVQELADDDCLLFMWSSSPHLDQAIELMKAWGFDYKTIAFVWNKMRVNPSFYTMSQIEICIVGKKGRIPKPRGARNIRQYVEHKRERHSKKPDSVRLRIEEMFPSQKKIELFAREKAQGWDAWGNEIESNIKIEVKK